MPECILSGDGDVSDKAKLLVEFSCSSLLVLAFTAHHLPELHGEGQPFVAGATVFLLVFMVAPISGACLNPAVAITRAVSGDSDNGPALDIFYFVVEILGGACGGLLSRLLGGFNMGLLPDNATGSLNTMDWVRLLVSELIPTFFLSYVWMLGAHMPSPSRGFRPLCLAALVFCLVMTFKDFSGAVMNPALATALWLQSDGIGDGGHGKKAGSDFHVLAVFFFIELVAGVLAGIAWRLTSKTGFVESIMEDPRHPASVGGVTEPGEGSRHSRGAEHPDQDDVGHRSAGSVRVGGGSTRSTTTRLPFGSKVSEPPSSQLVIQRMLITAVICLTIGIAVGWLIRQMTYDDAGGDSEGSPLPVVVEYICTSSTTTTTVTHTSITETATSLTRTQTTRSFTTVTEYTTFTTTDTTTTTTTLHDCAFGETNTGELCLPCSTYNDPHCIPLVQVYPTCTSCST
jgi:glycerol uptake facilitator-like aquaporin